MKVISEESVARLWKSRRLSSLRDDLGNDIEVICAGRVSTKPGCDFQDAVILVNSEKLVGDVEVHITSDLWKKHGHHKDPAYNGVILHVVMWQRGELPVRLEEGSPLPTVILSRHIAAGSLRALNGNRVSKCGVIGGWGATGLLRLLHRAGMERFRIKTARFGGALLAGDPDQVIYEGICRALGYSRNIRPFEELAGRLPVSEIYRLSAASGMNRKAIILGAAGLLPSQVAGLPRELYQGEIAVMENVWRETCGKPLSLAADEWCFTGVRPRNHPVRRLLCLGNLLNQFEEEGLALAFYRAVRDAGPGQEVHCLEKALLGCSGRWILGRGRAREIIVNQALPFLLADSMRTGNVALATQALYAFLNVGPLPDNQLFRYMKSLLGLEKVGRWNACAQQGLLHVYHSFCRTKDCAACPVSTCRKPGRG